MDYQYTKSGMVSEIPADKQALQTALQRISARLSKNGGHIIMAAASGWCFGAYLGDFAGAFVGAALGALVGANVKF